MSGQGKETVFDRYSKRRPQQEPGSESSPSAPPVEDKRGIDGEQIPVATTPRLVQPAPEGHRNDDDDETVQGGIYKAAFIFKSKSRQRLRLHYANGVRVKVLSYAYLIEVVVTSHQWLTLVFSSTIVTIRGRNLDQIIDSIQDERVRALVCFRPGIHPEPASHEPCILDIEERSLNDFASEAGG